MKYSTLFAVLFAFIVLPPSLAQQPSGGCSDLEVGLFLFGALGADSQCGLKAQSLADPTATPEQLAAALNTVCTAECGDVLADYYLRECGNSTIGDGLALTCLPTDNTSLAGNYCRFSFPDRIDRIDNSTLTDLFSCTPFRSDGSSCPVDCQVALQNFVDQVGCCYQNVYNNTEDLFDGNKDLLTNAELFDACNVTVLSACSEPFPGTSPLEIGICTKANINDSLADKTTGCTKAFKRITLPTQTLRLTDEELDAYCTEECSLSISKYYNYTCRDVPASMTIRLNCLRSEGMLGSRCQASLIEQDTLPFFGAAVSCLAFSAQSPTCPPGCADALNGLRDQLGCCYQSIFNNTEYLRNIQVEEFITEEEYLFITALSQASLWNACNVDITEECSMDDLFSAGATKLVASSIMVVQLAVLTYLTW